jgi:hypothetical protein
MMECCENVFSKMLSYEIEPYNLPFNLSRGSAFDKEAQLESCISGHTLNVVSSALLKAQDICDQLSAPYIVWEKGSIVEGPSSSTARPKRYKPDWAGVRRSVPEEKAPNLLPGETKVSQKWKSSYIEPFDEAPRDFCPNWLWPLRQVLTYCLTLNVRYGYIITDEELVVCRIYTPESDRKRKNRKSGEVEDGWIEYKAIPYNLEAKSKVDDELTIHLALWWLHLLAASSGPVRHTYGALIEERLQNSTISASDPQTEQYTPRSADNDVIGTQSVTGSQFTQDDGDRMLFSFSRSNPNISFRSIGAATSSFASNRSSEKLKSRRKSKGNQRRMENVEKGEPEKKKKKRKK